MDILKEDQKRHAHELRENFNKFLTPLQEFKDITMYFYGIDSEEYKNFYEKIHSFFKISKDIVVDIEKKYGE